MFLSVVIPVYNRRPILEKCVAALECQVLEPQDEHEIVVVDDGSTDDTAEWCRRRATGFPRLVFLCQPHSGPAAARNLGLATARGDVIVFIDSDIFVREGFLRAHAAALRRSGGPDLHRRVFTNGPVVRTEDFESPYSARRTIWDASRAYFATTNVAIARRWFDEVGLFDTSLIMWEDLEMGLRLKAAGLTQVPCPEAVGYHWQPPTSTSAVPDLIAEEIQRGRSGALLFEKHPIWSVRLMTQLTVVHRAFWAVLSLGGRLNERSLAGLLDWLVRRGRRRLAFLVAQIFLNRYCVMAGYEAMRARPQRRPHDPACR